MKESARTQPRRPKRTQRVSESSTQFGSGSIRFFSDPATLHEPHYLLNKLLALTSKRACNRLEALTGTVSVELRQKHIAVGAARKFSARWSARARNLTIFSLILLHAQFGSSFLAHAGDVWEQRIVDASLVTCGDLDRLPLPKALVAIGWIGGYYAGQTNNQKIDTSLFIDRAERALTLCREHKSMRVMEAVDQVLRQENKPTPNRAP